MTLFFKCWEFDKRCMGEGGLGGFVWDWEGVGGKRRRGGKGEKGCVCAESEEGGETE